MTGQRTSIDAALDLVLYAPVGLALTLTEELPKLAAKGRSGLGTRIATARVVGQFAVAQGRKEVTRRLGNDSPPTARPSPRGAPGPMAPAPDTAPVGGKGTARPSRGERAQSSHLTSVRGVAATSAVSPDAPLVGTLAIPGYDSLSASQVVQRLAGLSGPELQAVKDYESASRGRRTILARVGQLQGH